MHWWGEGMSGIAFAFIKAYLCEVTPTCKHPYKHYATGALLLTNVELNYHLKNELRKSIRRSAYHVS